MLQQIEHGDFDPSDYKNQAQYELELMAKEQKELTQSWIAGPDSLRYALQKIERKYLKRHNKLMEDHHEEEVRLLKSLRARLIKEFGVDCWYETLDSDSELSLIGFYYSYKKIAHEKLHKQNKELELETNRNLSL